MKLYTKMNVEIPNVEVDLPVLNKFLLCLPLRPGLIIWGCLQLVAVAAISAYTIRQFAETSSHLHGFALVQAVIVFMIIMIASFIEVINCSFLILGAHKKNANFLEVCYHYLKVKVPLYAVVLIISFILKLFVHCQNWYYYNLDSWRYTVLMENQALGVIDVALQFYLLLLVRSEIIKLEHPICWSQLRRCFQSNQEPIYVPDTADSLPEKPPMDV